MGTKLYPYVHLFDTLRDTKVSQPFVILDVDEVGLLISRIDSLCQCVPPFLSGQMRQYMASPKNSMT